MKNVPRCHQTHHLVPEGLRLPFGLVGTALARATASLGPTGRRAWMIPGLVQSCCLLALLRDLRKGRAPIPFIQQTDPITPTTTATLIPFMPRSAMRLGTPNQWRESDDSASYHRHQGNAQKDTSHSQVAYRAGAFRLSFHCLSKGTFPVIPQGPQASIPGAPSDEGKCPRPPQAGQVTKGTKTGTRMTRENKRIARPTRKVTPRPEGRRSSVIQPPRESTRPLCIWTVKANLMITEIRRTENGCRWGETNGHN